MNYSGIAPPVKKKTKRENYLKTKEDKKLFEINKLL